MKMNNKGFTLTELLVSVVIFGIVLTAAFGFMLTSAKSYNKVNDRLEIQTQSQMALNLIEEYVIDSVGGICFDKNSKTLYTLREPTIEDVGGEKKTSCIADVFRFSTEGNVLSYTKVCGEKTGDTEYRFTLPDESEFYEVTKDVGDFNVDLKKDKPDTISATISLNMKNRSAKYEGSINIALRNRPPTIKLSKLSD